MHTWHAASLYTQENVNKLSTSILQNDRTQEMCFQKEDQPLPYSLSVLLGGLAVLQSLAETE